MLDLWRGLALIDMAWVHLALHPIGIPALLASWIGEYTRFAAGLFVLLSGMTVGVIFGDALAGGGAGAARARHRLFRRAAFLLVLERAVAVAFACVEHQRVATPYWTAPDPDLWGMLTFREPGITGGLLLLYAVLLAATPALASLRARTGAAATFAFSLSLYIATQAGNFHWPTWTFPVCDWQPIFVAGYLVAPHLLRLRGADPALQHALLGGASLLAVMVFLVRNGDAVGIDRSVLPAWDFTKVPLRPAEMAWYLAASTATLGWSAWLYARSESLRRRVQWICRLGRWSLLVYVAHLFLQLPIIDALTLTDPPPLARTIALVAIVALMSVVAWFAECVDRRHDSTARFLVIGRLWRLVPAAGTVGGGVMLAALSAVLVLPHVLPEPEEWSRVRRRENRMAGADSDIATVPAISDENTAGGESLVRAAELEQTSPDVMDAELDGLHPVDAPDFFGADMDSP